MMTAPFCGVAVPVAVGVGVRDSYLTRRGCGSGVAVAVRVVSGVGNGEFCTGVAVEVGVGGAVGADGNVG